MKSYEILYFLTPWRDHMTFEELLYLKDLVLCLEQSHFQADLRVILNSNAPFLRIPEELVVQFWERNNPSKSLHPKRNLNMGYILATLVNPAIWDLLLKALQSHVVNASDKYRKKVLVRFVEDVVTNVKMYMEDYSQIFPEDLREPYWMVTNPPVLDIENLDDKTKKLFLRNPWRKHPLMLTNSFFEFRDSTYTKPFFKTVISSLTSTNPKILDWDRIDGYLPENYARWNKSNRQFIPTNGHILTYKLNNTTYFSGSQTNVDLTGLGSKKISNEVVLSNFLTNEDLMPIVSTLVNPVTNSNKVLSKAVGRVLTWDDLKPDLRHSLLATRSFEERSFSYQQQFIHDPNFEYNKLVLQAGKLVRRSILTGSKLIK